MRTVFGYTIRPFFLLIVWILAKANYVVIDKERFETGRAIIVRAAEYTHTSGHLNTVSGRRPQAVRRITQGLVSSAAVLDAGLRPIGAGALRWGMMVPRYLRSWPRQGKAILRREATS